MPSTTTTPQQQQQPQLKRRASLRDRLRGTWQRPAQPLEKLAEEDASPRVVYKPKHAAADFSRLPVSPLSPSSRHRRHHSDTMQPLDRDGDARDASAPRSSHAWSRHADDEAHHPASPRDRESARRSSRVSNDNYTLVPDAPSNVPIIKRPTAPFPSPEIQAESLKEKREDDVVVDDLHAESEDDEPSLLPPPQPPSDYELFLAQAEAQDRRWRRQQLMPTPAQLVHPAGRVRPDPHRQFATAGATTTPAAAALTAAGSNSDRAQSQASARSPTDARDQQRRRGTDPSRPARRESRRGSGSGSGGRAHAGWTPRATTAPITPSANPSTANAEKKHPAVSLTRPPPQRAMTAPSQSPAPPTSTAAPTKSQPPAPKRLVAHKTADGGDDDETGPGAEHQSQMSVAAGTAGTGAAVPHRQASLRQRFVEYIRPSRGQKA